MRFFRSVSRRGHWNSEFLGSKGSFWIQRNRRLTRQGIVADVTGIGEVAGVYSKFGPASLLFASGVGVIYWLVRRLNASEERERKAREDLLLGQKDATKILGDAGTLVKDALSSHDRIIEKNTEALNRLIDEVKR